MGKNTEKRELALRKRAELAERERMAAEIERQACTEVKKANDEWLVAWLRMEEARAEKAERALSDARDAALEEAAHIVDLEANLPALSFNGRRMNANGEHLRPIAKKIRALKTNQGKKP